MQKEVDLLIFDLDGTLVNSKKDIINSVNITLTNLGLAKKNENEIGSYIGTGVVDLLKKSLGQNHEKFLDKAMDTFKNYYQVHHSDTSFLYPGVVEILANFANKKKVIITNRNKEFASITLEKLDISSYFEDIIGGDDLACMKPDSCPLDIVIKRLKIDRNKAIMIGDMDIDILAGKKAHILTCAVTYGIGKKEDILKAKPDYIIDDIAELKNIIK